MIFGAEPAVEWRELFGNDRPVEVEIGSGKGSFLVEYALAHPDRNVLGLERQARWVRHTAERIARRRVANARVACVDAALVVGAFVRDESVHAYHVYFPDPWWKRRHRKRRLVGSSFARELFRTLVPGGVLYLATDVGERFEEMLAELATVPFEARVEPARAPGQPATNFEAKYVAEGRRIHYAVLRKPTPARGEGADDPGAKPA